MTDKLYITAKVDLILRGLIDDLGGAWYSFTELRTGPTAKLGQTIGTRNVSKPLTMAARFP